MGKVLGLTKNNDQYEDVPDDLKWAIPLHEHLLPGHSHPKPAKANIVDLNDQRANNTQELVQG